MTRAKDISKLITGTTVTDLTVGSSEPDLIIQDTDGTNQLMKIQQVGGASMIKTRSGSNDGEFYITGEVTGTNKMKISTSGQAYLYGSLDVSGAFTSQGIDDNADATAITIDSSERVNIGTGTPPTADSVFTVQKSSAANEFNVISSPTHASVINLGDTDDYNICRIKGDNSNNSLQFQTNNAERMRIDSSGNVGVGTSSPVNNLHIQGSSGLRIVNSDDTSNLSILGFDNNESPVLNLYSNNAVTAKIHSEGNSYFNGGNTGFGISSPLGRIHAKQHNTAYGIVVEANGNDAWLRLHHNNSIGIVETTYNSSAGFTPLTFKVANSERMRIDTSGNVGIGTSTIQSWARLELEGSAGVQTGANQALHIKSPSTTAGQGVGLRLNAASGSHEAVGIIGVVNNASGNAGSMTFHTYNGGGDIPERARITSSGEVGIGETNPTQYYAGANQLVVRDGTANAGITIRTGSSGAGMLAFADGATTAAQQYAGYVQYNQDGAGGYMSFGAENLERMRITSTSGLIKYNGVYVYYFLGSVANNAVANIDVTGIQSAGVTLVTAQYSHHAVQNYGAVRVSSLGMYGGSIISTHDIQNITSSGGGSWTYSTPSSGTLRITKNAGNYVGSGYWWVKVETFYGS